MRRSALLFTTMIVLTTILPGSPGTAFGQFSPEQLRCRSTVAKAGAKLAKATMRAIADCHHYRNTGAGALDCNSPATADLKDKLPQAEAKFVQNVTARCEGILPSTVLFQQCPAPCDVTVPALTGFDEVAECLVCLNRSRIEELADAAYGDPAVPLATPSRKCHRSVTKSSSRFFDAILRSVSKCQSDAEKAGAVTVTECTDAEYPALLSEASAKVEESILNGPCAEVLPDGDLDSCGGATDPSLLASCVVSTLDDGGKVFVEELLQLPTPTTIPVGDPACPGSAELVLLSRDTKVPCSDNGDCAAPRTCDQTLGHCTSVTDVDLGWTGLGHESDSNDGVRLGLRLYCEGPAGPTCGSCDIVALDPAPGNCRCIDDPRIVCDDPFAPHSDDCPGSGACQCYAGPPAPLSFGGTPLCVVDRITEHPDGSIDVDTGDVVLEASLSSRIYLGSTTVAPCPTCGGTCSNNPAATCQRDFDCPGGSCDLDPVAGDGLRGGTCVGGQSNGLSCDVLGANASLPAFAGGGGGSGYSLDCLPSAGLNVSGSGLKLNLSQKTGASSHASGLSCPGTGAGLDCPCLLCSSDPSVACAGDTDCAALRGGCAAAPLHQCDENADCATVDVGTCHPALHRCTGLLSLPCSVDADCQDANLGSCEPATCSSRGFGVDPLPNDCEDLLCTDLGGGEGQCTTGPDDRFCDGVTRADGRGILACSTNDDCTPATVGIDAGDCTIVERRACFLDPVVATGASSATAPLLAGSHCVPPTSNLGINAVAGLPGLVRQVQQTTLSLRCAGDPMVAYTPGVGGCP